MEQLAIKQDDFLGMDSVRTTIGIMVSNWKTLEAIKNWKQQTDHLVAQQKGRQVWCNWYNIKICKVEKEYGFNTDILTS